MRDECTERQKLAFALSVISGRIDPTNLTSAEEMLGMSFSYRYAPTLEDYKRRAEEILYDWLTRGEQD